MDMTSVLAEMNAMDTMLASLYDDTISQVSAFVNLGRAIGGLGALVFIASRVWGHQARAEPIDVYPLLRPFLIGLCIILFPQLCSTLRGITLAISHSTDSIRNDQTAKIEDLQKQKVDLLAKQPGNQYFVTNEAYEQRLQDLAGPTGLGGIGDRLSLSFDKMSYDVNQSFREWMKNMLELFHVAARLLLSVLATFLLIVLSMLGPLSWGIAIIPGFGGGIQKWLGHFITISLWIPVANVFGFIMATFQVRMLQGDVDRIQSGAGVDSADFGYLVFLCIAIAGYLLVPFVTDMLIAASGAGGAASAFMGAATGVAATAGAGAGAAGRGAMSGVAGGAQGIGAAVGAVQGMAGAAGAASSTRGEAFGQRMGSALRERVQSRFPRS